MKTWMFDAAICLGSMVMAGLIFVGYEPPAWSIGVAAFSGASAAFWCKVQLHLQGR